jgi:hypothetical protein
MTHNSQPIPYVIVRQNSLNMFTLTTLFVRNWYLAENEKKKEKQDNPN